MAHKRLCASRIARAIDDALWFRDVVDNVADAIFIHNLDSGAIEFVNHRVVAMWGWDRHDLPALTVGALSSNVPPYTQDEAVAALHRAAAGTPQVFEWHSRHRDGSLFWVEVSIRRASLGHGPDKLVVVARDISERKAAAQDLQRTVETLGRTVAELERFAELASHDLREPLRAVVLFSQLLQRRYAPILDQDGKDYLGHLIAAARRMMAMVDGIMEASRVEAVARPWTTVDLAQVVAVVRRHLAGPLAASGAGLRVGPLPTVQGDEILLVQMMQNLVANAIKFRHPDRSPLIQIEAEPTGDGWQIAVRDNGIGIEPPYLEEIFQIFRRLHTQQQMPGSGIGLALCKRIVEHHGGRIWAESEGAGGTAILFTLPRPVIPAVAPDPMAAGK